MKKSRSRQYRKSLGRSPVPKIKFGPAGRGRIVLHIDRQAKTVPAVRPGCRATLPGIHLSLRHPQMSIDPVTKAETESPRPIPPIRPRIATGQVLRDSFGSISDTKATIRPRRRVAIDFAARGAHPAQEVDQDQVGRPPTDLQPEEKGSVRIQMTSEPKAARSAPVRARPGSEARPASSARMMTDTVCAESPVIRAMSDLASARLLPDKAEHQSLVVVTHARLIRSRAGQRHPRSILLDGKLVDRSHQPRSLGSRRDHALAQDHVGDKARFRWSQRWYGPHGCAGKATRHPARPAANPGASAAQHASISR
jgi:hypothetical protein